MSCSSCHVLRKAHTFSAGNFRMRSLGSSAFGDRDSSVASASRFQVEHVALKEARPVLLALRYSIICRTRGGAHSLSRCQLLMPRSVLSCMCCKMWQPGKLVLSTELLQVKHAKHAASG